MRGYVSCRGIGGRKGHLTFRFIARYRPWARLLDRFVVIFPVARHFADHRALFAFISLRRAPDAGGCVALVGW